MSQDNWGNGGGDQSWTEGVGGEGGNAAADDFEFDTSATDPDKVGGRGTVDKVGKYHFEVVECKDEPDTVNDKGKSRSPSVNYTLRVLESVPGQSPAGSVTWHRCYYRASGGGAPPQGSVDGMVDWLLAVGIFREVKGPDGSRQFINPRTGNTKFNKSDLLRCKDEQLIGNVKIKKDEQYGDKIELPMSGGAWRLDADAVADVPKNRDAAELWNPPAGNRGDVKFPMAGEAPAKGKGRGAKAKESAPAATTAAPATNVTQPAATNTPPVQTTATPAPAAVADDDF